MVVISTPSYPACTGNYTNSMHILDMALHKHVVYAVICIFNYYYFFNLALKLLVADIERLVGRKGSRPWLFWRCMFISEILLFHWKTISLCSFSLPEDQSSAFKYFKKKAVYRIAIGPSLKVTSTLH